MRPSISVKVSETMPEFSQGSNSRLASCCWELQVLFREVIKTVDCTIICGHRDRNSQEKAFREGYSKKHWPDSLHNTHPSLAVDVAPYDAETRSIPWDNIEAFENFGKHVKDVASRLGVDVMWGGDWGSFKDYPHWQVPSGHQVLTLPNSA